MPKSQFSSLGKIWRKKMWKFINTKVFKNNKFILNYTKQFNPIPKKANFVRIYKCTKITNKSDMLVMQLPQQVKHLQSVRKVWHRILIDSQLPFKNVNLCWKRKIEHKRSNRNSIQITQCLRYFLEIPWSNFMYHCEKFFDVFMSSGWTNCVFCGFYNFFSSFFIVILWLTWCTPHEACKDNKNYDYGTRNMMKFNGKKTSMY